MTILLAALDFEQLNFEQIRTAVQPHVGTALRVICLILIGLPAVWFLSRLAARISSGRFSGQGQMILRKVILYLGVIMIALAVTQQLGFHFTALLGAAGIIGIAIGFASQTSVSNIISGLFLIAERPFAVGDVVRIGGHTGIVMSIDLLSLKLRTFDNQFVRIPNEMLMKQELVNITRFPIRRVDTTVSVAYKEDLDRVRDVLLDMARKHTKVLDEPEPLVMLTTYNNSSVDFLFAVWCVKSDFFEIKKTLVPDIKKRFDEEGIEIPFPHVSLYAGSKTDPLPIRLVDGDVNSFQASMPDSSNDANAQDNAGESR